MSDLTQLLEALPDPLPIEPIDGRFDVTLTPPGSKSITCRTYVLAALAEGESRLAGVLRADDTDLLLDALRTLGAEASFVGDDLVMQGVGGRFPRGGTINLGDGGAPTRFMIAAACLSEGPVVVDGSERMRQRPVAEGVELLRQLGANIEYLEHEGQLPVRVHGFIDEPGDAIEVPQTLSSQFISALLLVGAFLPNGLALTFTDEITSAAYIALTARVLQDWGVSVSHDAFSSRRRARKAGERPVLRIGAGAVAGRRYDIEPDASSAVYWMVAAALCAGSRTTVAGLPTPSSQPDANVVGPLRHAGATITAASEGLSVAGPSVLHGITVNAHMMPDAAVAIATMAAMARRPTTINGLQTLRVKETDRIHALANELRKLGCEVTVADDTIRIDPSGRHEQPVEVETYHDHRMAMAFGVLGLARPGISIRNPACVSKSYPNFWRDLAGLYDAVGAE